MSGLVSSDAEAVATHLGDQSVAVPDVVGKAFGKREGARYRVGPRRC